MRARIARYRRADPFDRSDFEIGCRILTQPFFFDEGDWIPVPINWAPNIVSFKTYNTGDADGLALWDAVNDRLGDSLCLEGWRLARSLPAAIVKIKPSSF
jgi:putative restriction endonuclease